MSEVYDHYLQHWLRKFIKTLPYNERLQLRNLALCNKITMQERPVFLLSNGKSSLFFGQVTCKNSFACPCCSARIMAKTRTDIACCLDSLKEDYYAFMVTFALPHLKFMSCKETTDILYDTWRSCFINKNKNRKNPDGSFRPTSPINSWYHDNEITYNVRVSEYTWGENGWNPHFHVLFWVPRKYSEQVYQMETEIEKYWIKTAERKTKEYWQKNNLHGDSENQAKLLQQVFWARSAGYSVKFSKYEAKSSDYICGWGADSELTGNYQKQASHENHYTPYQILEKAANGDEEFAQLYREFMLNVTRKPVHRRKEFSKGLLQIAIKFKNTKAFKEVIKKKDAQKTEWKVVWWFSAEQWRELCDLNYNSPILSNILWLAAHHPLLLSEYLSVYGISAPKYQHLWQESVEKVFNNVA